MATRYGVISNGKMVDEFRADELAGRCGKNLVIHASDPQKAENVILSIFNDAQCTQTPENTIRMIGHVEDAGYINEHLIKAGVTVKALIPEGDKLEDYFLKLMGSHKYA